MARKQRWRIGFAALAAVLVTACADRGPATAPEAPRKLNASYMVSDTVYSDFTVSPLGGRYSVVYGLLKIDFPAGSICDISTSSYGPGEWDKPCVPTVLPVRVKSKAWLDAQGEPHVDFQPAMRFSPAVVGGVQLFLRDPQGLFDPTARIMYCATESKCFDESLTDATLRTRFDSYNGMYYRRIKHFSGYNVTARATSVDAETVSIDVSF